MLPNLHALLTRAAELRAEGASWEVVARRLHRRPNTCRSWPRRFPRAWQILVGTAQDNRTQEVMVQSLPALRNLMRLPDDDIKILAIELVLLLRDKFEQSTRRKSAVDCQQEANPSRAPQ